jgi:thioredoxin-related protein
MKKIIALLIVLINLSTVTAQEWQTDFGKAKEVATAENKTILLVFQGSDWCLPCKKLEKNIWNTDTFKKYAKEYYVMLKADFPRRQSNSLSQDQIKANASLAEKYNKRGIFPLVAILDNSGELLGETGYKKATPQEYIKHLNTYLK